MKRVPNIPDRGLAWGVTAARLIAPAVAAGASIAAALHGYQTVYEGNIEKPGCTPQELAVETQLCETPETPSLPIKDLTDVALIAGSASAAIEFGLFKKGDRLPNVIERAGRKITDQLGPIAADDASDLSVQGQFQPDLSDPFTR